MDARYTGHFYDLLRQATEFAKQQPRKNLWERNAYFYIPAVHGTWDDFTDMVDQSMIGQHSILGPQPVKGIKVEDGPFLSSPEKSNDYLWQWGLGEEADFITWLPTFDPRSTQWPFRNLVYNFPQGKRIPRQASVVAMSRVSARLFKLMHTDQVESGLGLASEMSPISWALFYGLKAVQIPQPIYHANFWSPEELAIRANPGSPARINGGRHSFWDWGKQDDIILNMTFMFASEFPEKLYRAWMGYDEGQEPLSPCLPPIFLHPVKNTG